MKSLVTILLIFIGISLVGQEIWEPISFPDTLKTKAINAEKEGVIFVSTGENGGFYGLFRSFDFGNSFELIDADTLSSYVNIFTIRYSTDNVLFIGANSRIYRSFNDGESFEKIFTGANNILKINFSPNNEIYAVGWSYIIRSQDEGNNWDTLFSGGNIYFSDIDFGLNGEVYTVGGSWDGPGTGSGFHRSLDNGKTWENIGITDQHLNDIEVNIDGTIIVGGESTAIYISTDNGVNWELQSSSLATAIESDYLDNLFAGVNGYADKGFRFSEDWGCTWANLNDPILNPYINQISISPDNTVYLQCENFSGQEYQLFKSINPITSSVEHEFNAEIKLFPNPTKGILNIWAAHNSECQLMNINGVLIENVKLSNDNSVIDLSHYKNGIYILNIISNSGYNIFTQKIIKN